MKKIATAVMVLGSATVFCGPAEAASSCEDLKKLMLPNVEVTAATLVQPGTFTPPPTAPLQMPGPPPPGAGQGPPPGQNPAQMAVYKTLPAFCRVAATLRPISSPSLAFSSGVVRISVTFALCL